VLISTLAANWLEMSGWRINSPYLVRLFAPPGSR
jgi:hypothetical protein